MLSVLPAYPGLSLGTWVRCWGCGRLLPHVSASCFPWEGDEESRGAEPGGAQGPHGKGAPKLHPQTCQHELAKLLTRSPAWVLTVLSSNPAITLCTLRRSPAGFPSSDTPHAGHAAPGHAAQHATDKLWDGLQLSLASANPTKHIHTQRATIMVLGSGLLSAAEETQRHARWCADTAGPWHLAPGPGKEPQPRGFTQRCGAEPLRPAGWRQGGTSRVPESGVRRVPGAPSWSSGSLRSLPAVTPQGPQSPASQVRQSPRPALLGCRWLSAEGRQPSPGAPGPASLPFACGGTAWGQRPAPQSPPLSCPARAELPGQRRPRGPLLFESKAALRLPSPKG